MSNIIFGRLFENFFTKKVIEYKSIMLKAYGKKRDISNISIVNDQEYMSNTRPGFARNYYYSYAARN